MQYMIESLSPTHLFKIVGIHLGFKYYSIHVSSNQAIKIKNYTYHSLTYSNLWQWQCVNITTVNNEKRKSMHVGEGQTKVNYIYIYTSMNVYASMRSTTVWL
jgi:hypothetical protein